MAAAGSTMGWQITLPPEVWAASYANRLPVCIIGTRANSQAFPSLAPFKLPCVRPPGRHGYLSTYQRPGPRRPFGDANREPTAIPALAFPSTSGLPTYLTHLLA